MATHEASCHGDVGHGHKLFSTPGGSILWVSLLGHDVLSWMSGFWVRLNLMTIHLYAAGLHLTHPVTSRHRELGTEGFCSPCLLKSGIGLPLNLGCTPASSSLGFQVSDLD